MTVPVEGVLVLPGTKLGTFRHRPLGAEPVSQEEKLSVKVVWRCGNPDRPGWEEL